MIVQLPRNLHQPTHTRGNRLAFHPGTRGNTSPVLPGNNNPPPLWMPPQAYSAYSNGHTALSSAASPLFSSSAAAISATTGGVGFFKLFLTFCAGGIFFSTAIATATACYAVGMDNVRRLLRIQRLLIRSVWVTFAVGLGAAKAALWGKKGSHWNWKKAWQVFKTKMAETKRVAAQGVDAIRQEAKLYAAAVGAPGLIPLQYVIDRLLPFSIQTAVEGSIGQALADVKNPNVRKLKLTSFSIGTKSPQLEAARVYDLGSDAMAFDCDVDWKSDMQLTIQVTTRGGLARLPVKIKKLRLDGVLRVVLTPLTQQAPGFGAALVSLPEVPNIGMDVRVAGGDITNIPWLRSELMSAIQKGIADELLWPRRTVIPTTTEKPGSKPQPLLSKSQLDGLIQTDPLLKAEQALAKEQPILKRRMDEEKPDASKLRKFMKVAFNKSNKKRRRDMEADEVVAEQKEGLELASLRNATVVKDSNHHKAPVNGWHHSDKIEKGVVWTGIRQSLQL